MLHINPDKCLKQIPLRTQVAKDFVVPEDWFNLLCAVMADDIHKLAGQAKVDFVNHMNRHAGPQSTYSLKPQLHDSLRVIYETLVHPGVAPDQKSALAIKILEGAPTCSPGFHDRCNESIISLSLPKNLDELLAVQRQAIVSRAANQATDEVHAYNRFFVLALDAGFGVWPMNPNDTYQGWVSEETIMAALNKAFADQYAVFNVLNALQEQLALLLKDRGYTGRREAGGGYDLSLMSISSFDQLDTKALGIKPCLIRSVDGEYRLWGYKDGNWQITRLDNFKIPEEWESMDKVVFVSKNSDIFNTLKDGHAQAGYAYEDYQKFNNQFLKEFVEIKSDYDLFLYSEDEEALVPSVLDINWSNVKSALLKKMREEGYFVFSSDEAALLDVMESEKAFPNLSPAALSLFSTPNELVQALVFFKEWPAAKKATLVHYYLANTKPEDEKAVIEKLEKAPELYRELLSDPVLQKIFLSKAINENRLDRVKIAISCGADTNLCLVSLVEKQNEAVMQWLASDAALRAVINQETMNAIADKMVRSPTGRQVLLTDKRLQDMCPQTVAVKLAMWVKRAEKQRNADIRNGLFVLANPEVVRFLQHVIYGEQAEAEAMLNEHEHNPCMLEKLLTAEATVTDYSRRRICGTAFRMALGAVDVRYHDDEECMVEMLQKWMRKLPDGEALMTTQIVEQFPKGYEEQERKRIADDEAAVIKVFDAIGRSANDAECEAALQEFENYLKPKGVMRTGKHFNEKLQEKAYELYDERYEEFGNRWDSPKNLLAWRRVNGGIQKCYTACLAQAASQGIYYIVDNGGDPLEKLQRGLELRNDRGIYFYPLDKNPASRLGFHYAIPHAARAGAALCGLRGWRAFFSKLCQTKNTRIGTTYAAARESTSLGLGLRNNVGGE